MFVSKKVECMQKSILNNKQLYAKNNFNYLFFKYCRCSTQLIKYQFHFFTQYIQNIFWDFVNLVLYFVIIFVIYFQQQNNRFKVILFFPKNDFFYYLIFIYNFKFL